MLQDWYRAAKSAGVRGAVIVVFTPAPEAQPPTEIVRLL